MSHDEIVRALLNAQPHYAWLTALLGLAPLIAKAFGGASKARAEARVQEAGLNNVTDTAAINRAVTDDSLTTSKQGRAKQNALLAGITDYSVTRPDGVPNGHATGGLRPSAISGGNALGKQFEEQDLASIMAGTPALTPAPKAGKFDKFLNIAGGLAGLAGLAGQIKNGMSTSQPIQDVTPKVNTNPADPLSITPMVPNTFVPPPAPFFRPKFTSRF